MLDRGQVAGNEKPDLLGEQFIGHDDSRIRITAGAGLETDPLRSHTASQKVALCLARSRGMDTTAARAL
jgi:hypothetical protein